jgi:HSP20 family molecular chaperone IbpA
MKNSGYVDMSQIFDDIFDAAQTVGEELKRGFSQYQDSYHRPEDSFRAPPHFGSGARFHYSFDDNTDYYPAYSYPPMNVYMKPDRTMVFEFALAGFDEKDVSLSFQGDYMVFSAALPKEEQLPEEKAAGDDKADEQLRWFKRRLRMRNIDRQKYYVPLDKYAQNAVKAVYKNGILRVTIPPKEEPETNDGIKIEIMKEGN